MRELIDLDMKELAEEIAALGEKPFRAAQLYDWLHKKLACSYEEMSNIPAKLKEALKERFLFGTLPIRIKQESAQDGTVKYLFGLPDGNAVETVLMRYRYGNSVCVSSQVGCRMGCVFCASTLGGLKRSLSAGEILGQIYAVQRDSGERVSHVVVMGIGEPLDNYDNVLRFIRMLSDEKGLNISQRNITLSTCGLVPEIRRLAAEKLQITLALSLHAVNDEKRKSIMPVAKRYSIAEVMEAVDLYFKETGRRVSFEYALIAGVNDTVRDADGLAALAAPRHCHVNLIPVNPVTERGLEEPAKEAVNSFLVELTKRHVTVTVRRELGRDIDGACGQLRHKTRESGNIM